MTFIADLHIHSKYSRATARNLDLEHLYVEARKKGITVIGTGDSTHPAWFAELKEKLEPAEEGLFRLKPDIEKRMDALVPPSCGGEVRYILESEISSIYKKNDKTRKNHNLVFFPDFDSCERFNMKLDAIGNITSDGRPILGIDARNLLEILLETHGQAFMIPAHIWTPWFSLLGSKSGFDSLEECFDDLSCEIFAVETGLSSDPPMNWRVSFLDNLTLVSNSDAHSPAKLGREANLFNTDLSYPAMRSALKTGDPNRFLGTLEFFPEEGKYHHDGHRKCEVSLSPEESVRKRGICPACGKPMTLGVNYRVLELADRKEGELPQRRHTFRSIIPLNEVIAEILGAGAQTKRVNENLFKAVSTLGNEFSILNDISISDIKTAGIPLLGEAIERIRNNCLHIQPGYDGEFGKIRIFTEDEKEELMGQTMMFSFLTPADDPSFFKAGSKKHKGEVPKAKAASAPQGEPRPEALNPLQEKVITHPGGPLVVVAGPGTGKTHTLTRKIAHLIGEQNVSPENILAITFTVKAAHEMAERLKALLPKGRPAPYAATFHALGHRLLREWEQGSTPFSIVDEESRLAIMGNILTAGSGMNPKAALSLIEKAKQQLRGVDDDLSHLEPACDPGILKAVYRSYATYLTAHNLWDFDDLVFEPVRRLESDESVKKAVQNRFTHVFVDEYQDLNQAQYRFVRALCPDNGQITVIGDPDQAIYGFRGSDSAYFMRFKEDFPGAETVSLNRNYRSSETILTCAGQMIKAAADDPNPGRIPVWSGREGAKTITVYENPTDKAEGTAIGKCIEQLMGGTGFHSVDFYEEDLIYDLDLGFSDFAILTRTGALGKVIAEALEKGGIPCQHVSRDAFWALPNVSGLVTCLKCLHHLSCPDHDKQALARLHPDGLDGINQAINGIKDLPSLTVHAQLEALADAIPGFNPGSLTARPLDGFQRLLSMALPFGHDAFDYLKTLSLATDQDLYDLKAEKVSIMTMHASKGLEFKVVFIAGCEEGIVPFTGSGDKKTDLHEERRLFYVAMTRAKDLLFLSYAKKRTRFGKSEPMALSSFVRDMDRKLLRIKVPNYSRMNPDKKPVQLSLF